MPPLEFAIFFKSSGVQNAPLDAASTWGSGFASFGVHLELVDTSLDGHFSDNYYLDHLDPSPIMSGHSTTDAHHYFQKRPSGVLLVQVHILFR
jgi:hypothetical protein